MSGNVPLPFAEDDPRDREERSSVPETSRSLVSDAAINHAADRAREDVQNDVLIWTPIGPRNVGGRIRALAQDPGNPRVLYAGAAFGGLWKTEDAGDTWRPLGTLLRQTKEVAAPIGAIGLCHRDPQHIYAGTGEPVSTRPGGHGLFYSSNGGARFDNIARPAGGGGPIQADRFERILVDPWQPKRAWIAAPTGLWRSGPGATAAALPIVGAAADAIDAAPVAGNPQDITDIAIDFGDRTRATPPAAYTVFAAVRGQGVFRAIFDTATNDYRVAAGVRWTQLGAAAVLPFVALPTVAAAQLAADPTRGRIKLAVCETNGQHVYFIMGQGPPNDGVPSTVFHSADGGNNWLQRPAQPDSPDASSAIGWYALTLEVHPTDPATIVAGSVILSQSTTNGLLWTRIMDGAAYDGGDRAQHADQHAVLFDRANPANIWAANDGGVSLGGSSGGTTVWRKRSHGIQAAQPYDVTIHPTFPFITGGGLQDNGSWVGFGGPSWYFIDSADGGSIGFEPGDPQRFLTTWQGSNGSNGLDRTVIDSPAAAGVAGGANVHVNRIPDIDMPGVDIMRASNTDVLTNFAAADGAVFGGRLEAVPGAANTWIMARHNRPYLSTDGVNFNALGTPAFAGANDQVTAIGIAPSDPANTWWIGTDQGEIFVTTNAGGAWTARHAAPIPAGSSISDIAVHPGNANVVAAGVDNIASPVFLSNDAGVTWNDISNSGNAADSIAPAPVACVRFDPRGSNGLADPQTIYAGTGAGVYVARGVVPRPAGGVAPQAVWRTLNNGLPLVLIQDMAFVEYREAGGAVRERLIRAATFGRGVYEVNLDGGPSVRLLVRSTVIDDGHAHEGAQALAFDPRLRPAAGPAQVPFQFHLGFDLRVDAPVSFDVGQTMDGAEFDEDLHSGLIRRGDFNNVYVQVQNIGHDHVDGVRTGLYFAPLDNAGNAPDLDADFWTNYPAPPDPAHVWQLAGEVTLNGVGPGDPRVARIVWNAPADLAGQIALLAITSHASDGFTGVPPTLQVDPRTHGTGSLVRAERRAVMRVVRTQGALFTRDTIDDTGEVGSVAWGARSLDIVIRQAAEADPDTAFASLTDRRRGDEVHAGADNHIFVRVTNRQAVQVQATVQLFRAAFPAFPSGAAWQEIGPAGGITVTVPPNTTRFTQPGFVFTAPLDVIPGELYKSLLFIALIGTPNDPAPDRASVTDLASFWRFLAANAESNNVACRALRVTP